MRTRNLPKMLNSEVESYLEGNDLIFVPVGTVEMHGGFPLDSETIVSEAFACRMASACDGLFLTGLPYFYAGATASGRGSVQVGVRQGIDYLSAIARNLLRQGFRRQVYLSFHGPAHMTCSPMVRDFFDKTGVPILYMDLTLSIVQQAADLFTDADAFHAITVGAYDIMGHIEDIPLSAEGFGAQAPQTTARFSRLLGLAYQSGSVGYYFGAPEDHMPTPAIPTAERRAELACEGSGLIDAIVERLDMPGIVSDLRELDRFNRHVIRSHPWLEK